MDFNDIGCFEKFNLAVIHTITWISQVIGDHESAVGGNAKNLIMCRNPIYIGPCHCDHIVGCVIVGQVLAAATRVRIITESDKPVSTYPAVGISISVKFKTKTNGNLRGIILVDADGRGGVNFNIVRPNLGQGIGLA